MEKVTPWACVLLGHCGQCWLHPAPELRGVAWNSVLSQRRGSVLNTGAFHRLSGLGRSQDVSSRTQVCADIVTCPSAFCRHPENPQMALVGSG